MNKTEYLKLNLTNMETDGNEYFDFDVDLNYNWKIIDDFSASSKNYPVFCFNSGPVDENGEAALLTFENNIITQHAPCVCTSADGRTYFINEDISLDISNLAEGIYNIFYNPETKELEIYNNQIYFQKKQPENFNVHDIWVDTSVKPYISKIKISNNEIKTTQLIQNARCVSISGGG